MHSATMPSFSTGPTLTVAGSRRPVNELQDVDSHFQTPPWNGCCDSESAEGSADSWVSAGCSSVPQARVCYGWGATKIVSACSSFTCTKMYLPSSGTSASSIMLGGDVAWPPAVVSFVTLGSNPLTSRWCSTSDSPTSSASSVVQKILVRSGFQYIIEYCCLQ